MSNENFDWPANTHCFLMKKKGINKWFKMTIWLRFCESIEGPQNLRLRPKEVWGVDALGIDILEVPRNTYFPNSVDPDSFPLGDARLAGGKSFPGIGSNEL